MPDRLSHTEDFNASRLRPLLCADGLPHSLQRYFVWCHVPPLLDVESIFRTLLGSEKDNSLYLHVVTFLRAVIRQLHPRAGPGSLPT